MRVELNNGSGTLRHPPFDHEPFDHKPFDGHLRCLQSSGHFLQRPVGRNTESTTDFLPNQRQRVSLPSVPSICSRTPCVEYSHRCVCLQNDRRPFQYIDNRHRALCQPCFFDGPVCLRSHSRNTGILTDFAASTPAPCRDPRPRCRFSVSCVATDANRSFETMAGTAIVSCSFTSVSYVEPVRRGVLEWPCCVRSCDRRAKPANPQAVKHARHTTQRTPKKSMFFGVLR